MFYLYYFLKLEICSHLAWRRKSARRVRRTPVGPPKYELLTTAVRKLLASVAFRSDLVVTRKTLQRPTYPPNTNHLRPPVGNKWLDGLRSRISARPECDLLGQDPLPAHRISTPTISRSQVFNHVRISVSFCPTRCLLKRRFPTPPAMPNMNLIYVIPFKSYQPIKFIPVLLVISLICIGMHSRYSL
jgi:hypothetical protein